MIRRHTSLGAVLIGAVLTVGLFGTDLAAAADPTGTFPMDRFLAHWWIFPVSIVFSTVAIGAGVSGALFFSPFFILVVGLSPAQAIGAGLMTEVFGMGNGLRSYVKQGVVDFQTAKWLLAGSIPAIILGSIAAHMIDPTLLQLVFGVGLIVLGAFLVIYDPPEETEPGELEGDFLESKHDDRELTTIEAADGERYQYETCWQPPGVALSSIGAFVTGLISAGLPEIVTTQLIARCRVPPRVAIATSVFVLAITATIGALVHALSATPVWFAVAWSIPGVLVGSTIGSRVGKYFPTAYMEIGLGIVFAIVGGLVLGIELLV